MLQEALPSIVASVYGWCTPAVLFVIVNIVIGSIAVASKYSHHYHHRHQQVADDGGAYPAGRSLSRSLSGSPSVVLDRLCSFNLHRYFPGDIHPPVTVHASSEIVADGAGSYPGYSLVRSISRSPSIVLDRLRSFNLHHCIFAEIPPSAADHETEIVDEATLPEMGTEHEQQDQHLGRSQSDTQPTAGTTLPKLAVRMKKSASEKSPFAHFEETEIQETVDPVDGDEGSEVDARADDFINRFRQQLKLQRLNSILRYKEMLSRGT